VRSRELERAEWVRERERERERERVWKRERGWFHRFANRWFDSVA
jgi:hypothetical protein